MKLYHVVAMSRNRVIGKDNRLPWHFPLDLKHFKQLTTDNTVMMGRKTFESIGRPLPNRINFILSRKISQPDTGDVHYFSSIEDALRSVQTKKVFIIGGQSLYTQTIEKADGIYLTAIDQDYEGDTFYPELPDYFESKSRKQLQEIPKIEIVYYENTKKENKCNDRSALS